MLTTSPRAGQRRRPMQSGRRRPPRPARRRGIDHRSAGDDEGVGGLEVAFDGGHGVYTVHRDNHAPRMVTQKRTLVYFSDEEWETLRKLTMPPHGYPEASHRLISATKSGRPLRKSPKPARIYDQRSPARVGRLHVATERAERQPFVAPVERPFNARSKPTRRK